jgi:outer membrane autotransporter protein
MAEIFAPIIFHKNNLAFMTKPKAGFAHGHYRRVAVDNTHKATTKEYYYGLDNIIRQNIDLNLLEIEPDAEFNLTGMYMDDIEESANGLKIKDKNVLSAQSVLGITARKRFEINSKSSLGLAVNAKYFHEFGKKYKNRATVGDMVGYYDIISNRLKRDFGLIGLKAQYDYQQFTLDASANLPLEEKHEPYYMLNVKYKF